MDGTSSCSFPFSSSLFLHAALLPHAFIVNDLLHHASFPVWAYIWRIKQLQRQYKFKNFVTAMAFANELAEISEAEGHHPGILVEWGKATVTWWSHSIKGLHRNDFVMAAKTDSLLGK